MGTHKKPNRQKTATTRTNKIPTIRPKTLLRNNAIRKNQDILLVKQQLGHKRIEHTLIYTHLINFKTDEYISRTVQLGTSTTLKEICELAEAGFTKFTEIEGYQIFKKPK
jgi:hypothetical protein